ncbi:Ribonucleotide reductase transcriptional regulator NrdR [hydrothermal vent metagenome]|uniref:Ribonucleotide reductase transcriptional regulator NrdR n=1 Tax=hydrothermal vent metagenome TaxID=652676 RepID=A0A3B0RKD4_9ZZZZ
MQCPLCQSEDTRVVDSRSADRDTAIRRRRSCPACGHRFTTYERAAVVHVHKRDGRLEPFDAEKVRRGVNFCLADRAPETGTIDAIVNAIETRTITSSTDISADDIGRMVLDALKDVDHVAYLRFASVHKEFRGAEDFERELASLDASDDG